MPVAVICMPASAVSGWNLEIPKSMIFTKSARPAFWRKMKTFSGFKSRWTTPASCAAPKPLPRII